MHQTHTTNSRFRVAAVSGLLVAAILTNAQGQGVSPSDFE